MRPPKLKERSDSCPADVVLEKRAQSPVSPKSPVSPLSMKSPLSPKSPKRSPKLCSSPKLLRQSIRNRFRHTFHGEKCSLCGFAMGQDRVSAKGAIYHPECFKCYTWVHHLCVYQLWWNFIRYYSCTKDNFLWQPMNISAKAEYLIHMPGFSEVCAPLSTHASTF